MVSLKETVVDGKNIDTDITHIKDPLMMDEFLSDCFDTDNIYIFQSPMLDFQITLSLFLSMLKILFCGLRKFMSF